MLFHIYAKEYVLSITVHPHKHMYVSIFKDLIHGYFSRGYIWLFFAIMLRQIIDRMDFIQTMRVVELTYFSRSLMRTSSSV